MSQYIEVYGELVYKTESDAQAVRDILIDGGWIGEIDGKLCWLEEGFSPIDTENAWTYKDGKRVLFNGGMQRNLGRVIDGFFHKGLDVEISTLRMFSNDGCFDLSELREGKMVELKSDEVSELFDCPNFYDCIDKFRADDTLHNYEDEAFNWVIGA